MGPQPTVHRFSGHDTFPCRYTWLPKAVRALQKNRTIFGDEDSAMVELGVGKNMVRAIRFWVQAAGIAASTKDGYDLTEFGRQLLGEGGIDPFLEDVRTLWLIHWNLSTEPLNPLFAWDYLLNRWQEPELTRRDALKVFEREAAKLDKPLSPVTLEHHFDVFLHTYVPTRGKKGEVQEDNLDCPLVELELIQRVGDRESDENGKREPVYAFRREEKPDITTELFVYCLNDFWQKRHPTEATLPFREIAHGHGSPGQIFKLPEDSMGCSNRRMNRRGLHGACEQRWSCAITPRNADSFRAHLHPDPKADWVPVRKNLATATHASAKTMLAKPNRRSVVKIELYPPFNMRDWDGEKTRQDLPWK